MFYKIEINLDNAAFGDEPEAEVCRILEGLVEGIKESGHLCGVPIPLRDFNGNVVGWAKVTK